MSTAPQALKLAREALRLSIDAMSHPNTIAVASRACAAIDAALAQQESGTPPAPETAQPAQEREAFEAWLFGGGEYKPERWGEIYRSLYTQLSWCGWQARAAMSAPAATPPARAPLTDEQIDVVLSGAYTNLVATTGYGGGMGSEQWDRAAARAIEAELRGTAQEQTR